MHVAEDTHPGTMAILSVQRHVHEDLRPVQADRSTVLPSDFPIVAATRTFHSGKDTGLKRREPGIAVGSISSRSVSWLIIGSVPPDIRKAS